MRLELMAFNVIQAPPKANGNAPGVLADRLLLNPFMKFVVLAHPPSPGFFGIHVRQLLCFLGNVLFDRTLTWDIYQSAGNTLYQWLI
jgi:hypothetical protein